MSVRARITQRQGQNSRSARGFADESARCLDQRRAAPAPAGSGSSPTGTHTTRRRLPRPPDGAGSRRAPAAARSSIRSTRPVTKEGCTPAVAARTHGSPSSAAVAAASVSRSKITSMWSLMNPIGTSTTPGQPLLGEGAQMVVDVRLQPRLARRTGPGTVDQVLLERCAPADADLPGHLGGDHPVPVDVRAVRAARLGTGGPAIASGIECVTKTSRAVRRARSAEFLSRAATDSVYRRGDEPGVIRIVPDPVDLRPGARRRRRRGSPGTAGRTSRRGTRWSPRPAPAGGRPRRSRPLQRRETARSCGCPRTTGCPGRARPVPPQRGQQHPALVVDRAAAAEREVVLADLGQPLRGNAATAGDVGQERQHLLRTFRTAEGDQEHRVVRFEQFLRDHSSQVILAHREVGRGYGSERLPAGPSRPRARAFSAAGFVARLPLSMTGLGIVLLVSLSSGSFGRAGLVAAVSTLTAAVFAPLWGRAIDVIGQARVLVLTAMINSSSLAVLVISIQLDAPLALTLAAAFGVGVGFSSAGSAVRARWTAAAPRLSAAADRIRRRSRAGRGRLHRRAAAGHLPGHALSTPRSG